jgi:hypothetical protein
MIIITEICMSISQNKAICYEKPVLIARFTKENQERIFFSNLSPVAI